MYTRCACKIFFSVCKIDTHATALMCREICFSKYGFMHGKDINSSHLGASFLLICDSLWQLSGQYFTAVCVSWVKKEKGCMQALLRMQSQVLRVKKCSIYSRPCNINPFPLVSNVMLSSFNYSVACCGFPRAPDSGQALRRCSFPHRLFCSVIVVPHLQMLVAA